VSRRNIERRKEWTDEQLNDSLWERLMQILDICDELEISLCEGEPRASDSYESFTRIEILSTRAKRIIQEARRQEVFTGRLERKEWLKKKQELDGQAT
jgi:hypothetical protein